MGTDDSWNRVYSYSRAQAFADDVLVDVTEAAKEIGFRIPTVVTDHLFHGYVEVPEGLEGEGQSDGGPSFFMKRRSSSMKPMAR